MVVVAADNKLARLVQTSRRCRVPVEVMRLAVRHARERVRLRCVCLVRHGKDCTRVAAARAKEMQVEVSAFGWRCWLVKVREILASKAVAQH